MEKKTSLWILWLVLILVGFGTFVYGIVAWNPARAWQAYLINFLLWSAIAQGGLLFSTIMTTTRARWSGPLSGLSEAFAGFFPVSFILFLVLFLGPTHVFPWSHGHDLHGKEVWLNVPFLFGRDAAALLILYGLGFAYLYQALKLKIEAGQAGGLARRIYNRLRGDQSIDRDKVMRRKRFGAYTFVKAFYVGLGALIITAAFLHLNPRIDFRVEDNQFRDIGKLFFAFCLVWADFFYVQLVVIWYGNIPEETAYVIERTTLLPWRSLAWFVFGVCFVIPFFVLLNQKVKTMPKFMIVLSSVIIAGIWLEHLLLLGPALTHAAHGLPLGLIDLLITVGFLGLMLLAVGYFLRQFPELVRAETVEVA